MKSSIIFTISITGHNLEYLHHIYELCRTKSESRYVFVIPEEFNQIKDKLVWEYAKNITFDFIPTSETSKCELCGNVIQRSKLVCRLLRSYMDKHNIDNAFVMFIMLFVPYVLTSFKKNQKISGIIYKIYLYGWKENTYKEKSMDVIKFYILSHCKTIKKVLVLNSPSAARIINKNFYTNKFVSLPDPYTPLPELQEPEEHMVSLKKTFIHLGAIGKRKGTLEILRSIYYIPEDDKEKYSFIFAGKVGKEIRDEFYSLSDDLKTKGYDIVIHDMFCDYGFLGSLCKRATAILMPYHLTDLSSGMLGYAAQFGTPVIAPNKGLLGKIVRNYKLGMGIKVSPEELYKSYSADFSKIREDILKTVYLRENNVTTFIDTISDVL